MASSGSVFSDTLQEITTTKLEELSKRRLAFEEAKAAILVDVQLEQDPVKRLIVLADGVKTSLAIKADRDGKVLSGKTAHPQLEHELRNLDRFLDQARCDPGVSPRMIEGWDKSLRRHLDAQSLKFKYASLYGELVTEWLSEGKDKDEGDGDDVEMSEAFEVVGNAAKMEAKMAWEKMAFHPDAVDETALRKYLDHLFGSGSAEKKHVRAALTTLRQHVSSFGRDLFNPNQFNIYSLKWVIQGLLSSDQLTNEKREVLKDFAQNDIILNEIADVLNMRLAALSTWSWNGESPVPVEMRRKISGIYDVQMSEHLLQSMFVQFIGVKWSVFFKEQFTDFRQAEGAWKPMRKEIPLIDKLRLGYYLGPLERHSCLEKLRKVAYTRKYFVTHLLNAENEGLRKDDGEEEVNYVQSSTIAPRKRLASKAARKSAPSTGQVGSKRFRKIVRDDDYESSAEESESGPESLSEKEREEARNPIRLKQTLLHMLSTEIILNTRLYGEMTALHTVFDNWDAALPHGTVLEVLRFFGVSAEWRGFFRKFLEAPLKFVDEDGDDQVRPRLGGTPPSLVLSDVFAETTLFCLDVAVTQATDGQPLWRIRDDVWFWSRDHDKAVKAWDAIDEFASVTGTDINPGKTGTVRVSRDATEELPIDENLPEGDIRWGFLRLSPVTGRFEIDQKMVDTQIEELRRQLSGKHSRSVLGFIQAWNTFAATFFNTNFGKAADCFGRAHVDNMLATHKRIQKEVFASFHKDGSVTSVAEHIKKELHRRFGVTDIPDGYLYFPLELGGLDLQSPFVSLLQIRDEVLESPTQLLDNLEGEERLAWERSRNYFLSGQTARERYSLDQPDWQPESVQDREKFMSFAEYIKHRECFYFADSAGQNGRYPLFTLPHNVWTRLMRRPKENSVELEDGAVSLALDRLKGARGGSLKGITGYWQNMEPYWRWVAMAYGPEVVERFGDLNIVDAGLLPMGMVSLFREKRVKW